MVIGRTSFENSFICLQAIFNLSSIPVTNLIEMVVYSLAMYVSVMDGYDVLDLGTIQSNVLLKCSVWEISAALLTLSWSTLLIHLRLS